MTDQQGAEVTVAQPSPEGKPVGAEPKLPLIRPSTALLAALAMILTTVIILAALGMNELAAQLIDLLTAWTRIFPGAAP